MIRRNSTFEIKRIPLSDITVWEHQSRYPERVLHYVDLMKAHPDEDCGFVSVQPSGTDRWALLDGHHRFCAAILTGRPDVLAIVIRER